MVFVSWGNNAPIKAVNLFSNEVTTLLNTSLGNIDGIDMDNDGNFYIASWNPNRISKYDNAFSNAPETITVAGLNSPADICYANAIDTLAIPNSGNETVSFIGFNVLSDVKIDPSILDLQLNIYPNPANLSPIVSYLLDQSGDTLLNIYTVNGKRVYHKIFKNQLTGKHHHYP